MQRRMHFHLQGSRWLIGGALVATLFAGCAGTYQATVADDGYPPDLVYAAPGVQVIADYDEPIFYSDGFYWRYYGGTWYQSPRYTGGWVVGAPPMAVRRIDRPRAFVHYRPNGWVARPRPVVAPHQRWGRAEPARVEPRAGRPGWGAPTMRGGPAAPVRRAGPAEHGPPPGRGFPAHGGPRR